MKEKESIEIVLQSKLSGDSDGRDASHYKDRRVLVVQSTREEVSKKLSEFCEEIEASFEQ